MSALRGVILNVEDNEAKRYVKTRVLRAAGFEVIEARRIEEAKALLLAHQPDLVLLDVHLPDGDGRSLATSIKSDPATAQVVVLQTSASAVESRDRVASLDAGADGYLMEPIEPRELVAHVAALLRLRQAESERQAAMAALRDADRRKDEFLAMLAHELRNPLAPIRNAVEILGTRDEAMRERARSIVKRQVAHLARLVDDLLDVSRITQRKVSLRRSVVSLASILDAAIDTALPFVQGQGQTLRLGAPPEDLWLEVDAVRIAQAIGNLLHNASKFSAPGSAIELQARVLADDIEIVVRDAGVGIAPEMLSAIFDLFVQDDRSLARSQGGLGIGLSLVRGMVEMHGGHVHASSDGRDRGSAFTIRLPRAGNEVAQPGTRAPAAAAPASTRRILVVEDNTDAAESLRILLEQAGHRVAVATNAWQALEAARCTRPDVALLDIGLPGMDGYELAGRLRRMPESEYAYLVAVSGYGEERDRARSAAAGFDRHLTKPVDPALLFEAIHMGGRIARHPDRAALSAG